MDDNGALTPDGQPLLDYETLLQFAEDVIAELPYPSITAHKITEYAKRILRRCPNVEWPLTPPIWNYLQLLDTIGDEGGGDVLDEDPGPLLLED